MLLMARPQYERPLDLRREEAVADVLSDSFGCDFVKNPKQYRMDYAVIDPWTRKIKAFAEFKWRPKNAHDMYSTYMISLSKWMAMADYHRTLRIKQCLVVAFTDGIWKMDYDTNMEVSFEFRGRSVKSRDNQDEEPCVMIPVGYFERLADRPEVL